MSWSGSNELRAVLDRARRHVVSNGLQVTGKITVPVTAETPDLYRLALAMRRVKVDSTSTKVPIYVQSLDSWLQRPLNGGRSLLEVLDAESPLVDRPAERSAKNDAVDRRGNRSTRSSLRLSIGSGSSSSTPRGSRHPICCRERCSMPFAYSPSSPPRENRRSSSPSVSSATPRR